MPLCDFADNDRRTLESPITVFCRTCGRTVTTHVFPIYANCRGFPVAGFVSQSCGSCGSAAPVAVEEKRPLPLGDWVAWVVKRATFGYVVPCSSCSSRQQKLNRVGAKIWGWWNARK